MYLYNYLINGIGKLQVEIAHLEEMYLLDFICLILNFLIILDIIKKHEKCEFLFNYLQRKNHIHSVISGKNCKCQCLQPTQQFILFHNFLL